MKCFPALIAIIIVLPGCNRNGEHQIISSDRATAESVYLTHDQNNNPVVVWTEKQDGKLALCYAISEAEGRSVAKRINIRLAPDVATHAEGMPKVAFKNDGTVIAAYEKKVPTKENKYAGAIYYRMSTDEGRSWTPETFLHSDTVAGRSRSYFDIERLPDGEVGASWLDIKLKNASGGRSVRFAKTTKTKGFANEILIDSSACQCCRIDVCTDSTGNIFIAYRGLKKGIMGKQIRDMMIATSIDQGAMFSSPVTISADQWNIDGCPHTGPSLCSNKAGLFSLWYTEGSGSGVYCSQRSGTDTGFSAKQLVSNDGHHPQLTANGDRIAMLWEETIRHEGNVRTAIYYRIAKNGIDVEKKALTPKGVNAFCPVVTKTNGGFLTAFLMEKDNHVGVYLTWI